MITISIYGLDQFVVGHYSKEHTSNLANLMETESANISFFSPNAIIFHNGVEQTSWNTLVIVRCPKKLQVLEKKIADYFIKTLNQFTINVLVQFDYFEQDSSYQYLNPDYPRFITTDNIQTEEEVEEHDHCDDEECDCHHDHEEENAEDIYLGNAFEGFEDKLAELESKKK